MGGGSKTDIKHWIIVMGNLSTLYREYSAKPVFAGKPEAKSCSFDSSLIFLMQSRISMPSHPNFHKTRFLKFMKSSIHTLSATLHPLS